MDHAWEQYKPEAGKMPVKRDESRLSVGHPVGRTPLAGFGQSRRFLRSLGYLLCGFSRLLSQEHMQLCGVFLHMTHGVQQKLRKGQFAPGEPAQPAGLFS